MGNNDLTYLYITSIIVMYVSYDAKEVRKGYKN